MTTSELIAKSFLLATGRVSNFDNTSANWTKLLQIANMFLMSWVNEPGVNWASLYDPDVECGTIGASDTYDIDDSLNTISNQNGDYIRVRHLDDPTKYTNYTLVGPEDLKQYQDGYCARIGRSLKFTRAFTSTDKEYGGTLLVPGYTTPDLLVNDNDDVPIDDPMWLVFMTAAEWVRNDLTLAQNYPNLVALAQNAMTAMKQANQPQLRQVFNRPSVTRSRTW